jgi:predicted dinucleotide-binding enzyme
MKIGVVGAGSVGTAIAKRLVPRGHEVMLSYSRDVAKLEGTAKAFGAITGSPADAVRFGDVVALAVPWSSVEDALKAMGSLTGKVLWDCTNGVDPPWWTPHG